MKYIEDMRKIILSYKLLNDKKMFLPNNFNSPINKLNVILFGPSGSGKSSFIKTLYRSLYGTPFLPPDAMGKLIIKSTSENEGTLSFTKLILKHEEENSSSIVLCDTRGQIWMDENEKEQFKVIIDGKIKEDAFVNQTNFRDPYLLYQFWKKDCELFPMEIFNSKKPGIDSLPHSIIFVVDGSIEDVINKEDEKFYRELVNISLSRGYPSIHVILTRIDIVEKEINENNKKFSGNDRINIMNNAKDQKIEKIIQILGLKRSNVHFIENYHNDSQENSVEIDYHALKTLQDIMNLSEQFLLNHFNKSYTCFNGCI